MAWVFNVGASQRDSSTDWSNHSDQRRNDPSSSQWHLSCVNHRRCFILLFKSPIFDRNSPVIRLKFGDLLFKSSPNDEEKTRLAETKYRLELTDLRMIYRYSTGSIRSRFDILHRTPMIDIRFTLDPTRLKEHSFSCWASIGSFCLVGESARRSPWVIFNSRRSC